MGWIGTIIIGILAGAIAGFVTRGKGLGCLWNLLVGYLGSLLGSSLFRLLGFYHGESFWPQLLVSTVGAIVLLTVWNLLTGRRRG
ncbi:MAG: GlsB/YeaQ/YmgE family stress response membrane protein [Porphyromonas sp.]|nr:GlsB/YeaQ/YmgE family stress response membrane protein [Porphyromonas sp.]